MEIFFDDFFSFNLTLISEHVITFSALRTVSLRHIYLTINDFTLRRAGSAATGRASWASAPARAAWCSTSARCSARRPRSAPSGTSSESSLSASSSSSAPAAAASSPPGSLCREGGGLSNSGVH